MYRITIYRKDGNGEDKTYQEITVEDDDKVEEEKKAYNLHTRIKKAFPESMGYTISTCQVQQLFVEQDW